MCIGRENPTVRVRRRTSSEAGEASEAPRFGIFRGRVICQADQKLPTKSAQKGSQGRDETKGRAPRGREHCEAGTRSRDACSHRNTLDHPVTTSALATGALGEAGHTDRINFEAFPFPLRAPRMITSYSSCFVLK